ncbi:hypothetical protein CC78DRAFT_573221 [Lojkania enalia]|uniref:Uncharacterized protein n=1 Tax=Lojkania enalia TaxID=147567 RepID=A0A9P4TRW8_9PLEO|nr:hypothetical protein CC78DRAFT_573221 [Didymosphaeria enalia]
MIALLACCVQASVIGPTKLSPELPFDSLFGVNNLEKPGKKLRVRDFDDGPITDEAEWDALICKCRALDWAMRVHDASGLREALEVLLDRPVDPSKWRPIYLGHGVLHKGNIDQMTYIIDGRTFRKTGAIFVVSINIEAGKVQRAALGHQLPTAPRDRIPVIGAFVRHPLGHNILNSVMVPAIRRANRDTGKRLQNYPGGYFNEETDEFEALLGTFIGRGVAYMILQHKRELGYKYISGILVFRLGGNIATGLAMQFFVEDV